jgi:ribosome-associated translation inhibitor RaiA
MTKPTSIVFRGMDPSSALTADIESRVERLRTHYPSLLQSCQVVVDRPHESHSKGNHYHVVIELGTAKGPVVVSKEHGERDEHEDAYLSVRDAFKAAERQLEPLKSLR